MPSPLAHAGLALCLYAAVADRPSARAALVVGLASILPDFDVLPMLWDPRGIAWHRGPTHSLLGAAALGLAASVAVSGWRDRAACVAAAALHVPLDWSTGAPGAPVRYGVPVLWPVLGQKFIAANPWFGAFGIDSPSGLRAMLGPEALAIYGKEALTVALGAALATAVRAVRRRASGSMRGDDSDRHHGVTPVPPR